MSSRPMRFLAVAFLATAAFAQDVHVRVDPHGPGSIASATDYKTIQNALDHAPQPAAPHRLVIEIAPGIYTERISVTRLRPRVTLLGLGHAPSDTVITDSLNAKTAGGTYFTETAQVNADDFEADNLTFANSAGNTGQAVAAAVRSDRAVFKHVRFMGDQDTLFADYGRQYYLDCFIAGGVDFIFGNAAAVFDHSELHILRPGYLTAQSRTDLTQTTGYVITNSRVTSSIEPSDEARARPTFFLGRPWRPYARVIFMNTELPQDLDPAGWSKWKPDDPTPTAFYAEFHNTGPSADTTHRAAWSHQLTAKEAAAYQPQSFLTSTDHWNPLEDAARLP